MPLEASIVFTVDRVEGEIAVLVRDDGAAFDVPRHALGVRVRAGVVLRVRVDANGSPDWAAATIDEAEHQRRVTEARERLDRLRRTDPGGDVVL